MSISRTAQLAVVQSAEQTKAGVRYKEPKSGRARTVALSATVVAELRAHRIGKRRSCSDSANAYRTTTSSVHASRWPAAAAAQPEPASGNRLPRQNALPRIRFHDLRHAHATHLLA